MVSTDQYYYACATFDLPGLMVTASHNPAEYCGFKMVRKMPYLLSGDEGIQDLLRIIEADDYAEAPGSGRIEQRDMSAGFIDCILGLVDVDRMRIGAKSDELAGP